MACPSFEFWQVAFTPLEKNIYPKGTQKGNYRGAKTAVPKPCSSPLTPNPFETYRDPVTGRWLVRYPASTLPVTPLTADSAYLTNVECLVKVEDDPLKLFPAVETSPTRRRWEAPARTKVA
jgi:hypothetical protein